MRLVSDKKEISCNSCFYCRLFNPEKYEYENGYKVNHKFWVECDYLGFQLTSWTPCNHYKSFRDIVDIKNKQDYLFIFLGKSAAGKDTAINYLCEQYGLSPIISHTTRPMRTGEKQDVEYHFVGKKKFQELKKNGFFFDERKYQTFDPNTKSGKNTWYYGIGKDELYKVGNKACAVDLVGLENIKNYDIINKLVVVYIDTSDDRRKKRAKTRGSFNKDEWERRLVSDNEIFTNEVQGLADFVIKNNSSLQDFHKNLDKIMEKLNIAEL